MTSNNNTNEEDNTGYGYASSNRIINDINRRSRAVLKINKTNSLPKSTNYNNNNTSSTNSSSNNSRTIIIPNGSNTNTNLQLAATGGKNNSNNILNLG